jgi:hypothetical protein
MHINKTHELVHPRRQDSVNVTAENTYYVYVLWRKCECTFFDFCVFFSPHCLASRDASDSIRSFPATMRLSIEMLVYGCMANTNGGKSSSLNANSAVRPNGLCILYSSRSFPLPALVLEGCDSCNRKYAVCNSSAVDPGSPLNILSHVQSYW